MICGNPGITHRQHHVSRGYGGVVTVPASWNCFRSLEWLGNRQTTASPFQRLPDFSDICPMLLSDKRLCKKKFRLMTAAYPPIAQIFS